MRHTRDARMGRALAIRDRAMRLALTQKKHLVVADQLQSVPDPDVKTYLAAADSEAKLLGLNAPERKELIFQGFAALMQDWVQVLIEEVHDVALRQRIIERMQRTQDDRIGEIEEGRPAIDAVVTKQVEARVVDVKMPPADPSTNGTNGAHA
jgi:hypothetical protein